MLEAVRAMRMAERAPSFLRRATSVFAHAPVFAYASTRQDEATREGKKPTPSKVLARRIHWDPASSLTF